MPSSSSVLACGNKASDSRVRNYFKAQKLMQVGCISNRKKMRSCAISQIVIIWLVCYMHTSSVTPIAKIVIPLSLASVAYGNVRC